MSGPGTWSAWLHRHWLPVAMAACAVCALAPIGLGQLPLVINGQRPSLGTPIEHHEGPGDAEASEPIIEQVEKKTPQILNFPATPSTQQAEAPQVLDFPPRKEDKTPLNDLPAIPMPAEVDKPKPRVVEKPMSSPLLDLTPLPGQESKKMPSATDYLAPLVVELVPPMKEPSSEKPALPLIVEQPATTSEIEKPGAELPRQNVSELPRVMEKVNETPTKPDLPRIVDRDEPAPPKSPESAFVPPTSSKVGVLPTELASDKVVEPPPPMFQQARFGSVIGVGPAPEPQRIEATQVGDPAPIEEREKPRTSGLSYSIRPVRFDLPMPVLSPDGDDEITLNVTNRARPPQMFEPAGYQPYGNYDMPAWPGGGRGLPCNVTYRQMPPRPAPVATPAHERVRELMVWPFRALTQPFRDLLD